MPESLLYRNGGYQLVQGDTVMKTVDQCECIRGRVVAGIFQMNELCMFSFLDFAEEFKVDVYFPFDEVYR